MEPELLEELNEILDDLRNGHEIGIVKGLAGYAVSPDATEFIKNLLAEALEGK